MKIYINRNKVLASESNKFCDCKHSIMAGAGGGITIELADITVSDASSIELYHGSTDRTADFAEYTGTIDTTGTASGTIDIESIGTYYDGGILNMEDIPVEISVLEITPDDEDGFQTIIEEGMEYVLNDLYFDNPIHYGGGWLHITFKGDITLEAYTDYATLKLLIEISDKKIVEYLDKYAHGDDINFYYNIYADGERLDDHFDSDEGNIAIETAEEYLAHGEYNVIEVWKLADREDVDGNFESVDELSEIVWSSY